MKTTVSVLLVLGVVLAQFNPDMDDFEQFVEARAEQRIEEETGGGVLGRALAGAGGRLLRDNTDAVTERTSYVVCSLYHVDVDDDGTDEWRFLGVADRFIELEVNEQE